jgi:hypothetical protein
MTGQSNIWRGLRGERGRACSGSSLFRRWRDRGGLRSQWPWPLSVLFITCCWLACSALVSDSALPRRGQRRGRDITVLRSCSHSLLVPCLHTVLHSHASKLGVCEAVPARQRGGLTSEAASRTRPHFVRICHSTALALQWRAERTERSNTIRAGRMRRPHCERSFNHRSALPT